MPTNFKLGIVFGLIALVGLGFFLANIVFKLAFVFMALGVAFVGYYLIKGLFFRKG
jgi:hypothetical protein